MKIMGLSFEQRITVHQAIDLVHGECYKVLDGLRGLGIEGRGVKALAVANIVTRYVNAWLSPHDETGTVNNMVLKRLLHATFDLDPGWNQCGDTWVWLEHKGDGSPRASVDGHTAAQGGEAGLWAAVKAEFSKRIACAVMAETRDGYLRVFADRTSNVRPMTTAERALASRVRKYSDTKTPVSLLLWGPQGSAKTTAACSIAASCTGGYFRLGAEHVNNEVISALVNLRPGAVIIDDIDRVLDVSLLDLLDTLSAAGVIVICTSNTAPDARNGEEDLMDAALVRSGRMDIHVHVAGLDAESHAEICRSVGLANVDLGPDGPRLLASDLAQLGRMHRAGDLPDAPAVVDDLLARRTNTRKTLRAMPFVAMTAKTMESK